MKILVVCSGLDFINYTRRATIESIHKLNPDTEILMFNSILNIRKKKLISTGIKFHYYHFWVVEGLRKSKILPFLEYIFRYFRLRIFFSKFDKVFFIDPNQYYLLPYLTRSQKLIYLLRDPSVLMNSVNYSKELPIIKRADLILGISRNLCGYYFEKYYDFVPKNVSLWANTVDLGLWDYDKLKTYRKPSGRPKIGLAGNITYVIDIELLLFIAKNLPDFDIEIAGKLDISGSDRLYWDDLLMLENVRYLGYIPFNDFPTLVINWDIGLVAAKPDHEFAKYLNNNKQYQYVALGKPFVTYHFNADYEDFEDFVFIAESREDFVEKIRLALKKSKEPDIVSKGLAISLKQSAETRAIQFLDLTSKLT